MPETSTPQPKTVLHLSDLTLDPENARKHNPRNVGMVGHSLQSFGPIRSISIDENNVVLAGNATVEAAAAVGIEGVRVFDRDTGELGPEPPGGPPYILAVRVTGLTPEQKRQYAIADNRTTDLSEWDTDVLQAFLDEGTDLGQWFFEDELAGVLGSHEWDEPPSLDELAEAYGDPDDTAFWPEIKVKVPPDTFERWESLMRLAPGENDAERVLAILEAVDAAAFSYERP